MGNWGEAIMRDRLLQPIGKQANLPGVRDLNAEISYELNTEFPMRSPVNHPPHPDGSSI